MKKIKNIKERWILGSLASLTLLPVIFILGLIVGINFADSITLSPDTLSSWVSAIATVIIAILTIVLAKETWELRLIQLNQIEQIRKDSIKPNVSLYLKSNPSSLNFIDVHVVNNGKGTAQNIKFEFQNASLDSSDVYEHLLKEFNKLAILKKGISSLSSNEHRVSFLFSFIELMGQFGERAMDSNFEVSIFFEDSEGLKYSTQSYFNFAEYRGISEIGGEPLYKISSHLEKMKNELGHLVSGFKKIKVDVYSSEDREKQHAEWEQLRKVNQENKSE